MSSVFDEETREQEIADVSFQKPHLVLLGAGASVACLAEFENDDRHGMKLPLLREVAQTLRIADFFPKDLRPIAINDFESAYSRFYVRDPSACKKIDDTIRNYFSKIGIPKAPTIYDHLLLSLRAKDYVFSFNWDPLLPQAYSRLKNSGFSGGLPSVYFLHGNVLVGYCSTHKERIGYIGNRCPDCQVPFTPSRLLYPVEKKDYQVDSFIEEQWSMVTKVLKIAFMVTFFGYSAPKTDVEALRVFKDAWGDPEGAGWKDPNARNFEQIEIISRPGSDPMVLRDTWKPFIHSHHYEIHESFYDSWMALHPRRTGEAYWKQFLEAKFLAGNPIPRNLSSVAELVAWYGLISDSEGSRRTS